MATFDLRAVARTVKYIPDRLLHASRREAALAALRARPRPRSVLFVCHGNICRSPYAAAAARRLLPASIAVESAGFIGGDRPSPDEARAAAAERGLDLTGHLSKVLQLDHVKDVDAVFVMEERQRRRLVASRPALAGRVFHLGDLDPLPVEKRTVLDPVEKPIAKFRESYDRIDRCVGALAALWQKDAGQGAESERQ